MAIFDLTSATSIGSEYKIYVHRDDGTRRARIDKISGFWYLRVVNNLGAFVIDLADERDALLMTVDSRISFWRRPEGGTMRREFYGIIRRFDEANDAQGVSSDSIGGPDFNYILKRRIIAYAAGSGQASKTDQADDMIKAIARENLGTSAAAARQIASTYFTVAPDAGLGQSITKAFAYDDQLEAMSDVANASRQAGTEVFFDVVPIDEAQLQLQTFTGQRGRDLRGKLIFSQARGNLSEPHYYEDWNEEYNYVYAGGMNQEDLREIITASDSTRLSRSIFSRGEKFVDARTDGQTGGVTAKANASLVDGRPVKRFTAKLRNTPGARYAVDWDFGDYVSAVHRGRTFDAMVRAVKVAVDGNGAETVEATIESYAT